MAFKMRKQLKEFEKVDRETEKGIANTQKTLHEQKLEVQFTICIDNNQVIQLAVTQFQFLKNEEFEKQCVIIICICTYHTHYTHITIVTIVIRTNNMKTFRNCRQKIEPSKENFKSNCAF